MHWLTSTAYLDTQPTYVAQKPFMCLCVTELLLGARGYLAFSEGLISNQFGLWLDIPAKVLFGEQKVIAQRAGTR